MTTLEMMRQQVTRESLIIGRPLKSRSSRPSHFLMFLILLLYGYVVAASEPVPIIDKDLDKALEGLQKKYSQVRDLKMEFIQSERSPRRPPKTATGMLVLKRPGMMRWEYKTPT